MASRFLIGRGELLTYDIPPPPIKPGKAHPYSLAEARAHLLPQIAQSTTEMLALSDAACPADYAVAKFDLHPAYIAKSFFPAAFLRRAGLAAVGSRTIMVTPRRELRKTAPATSESSRLFVAGTRANFERLPDVIEQLDEETREAIQFAEIEDLSAMVVADRMRGTPGAEEHVFEAGLHLIPDQNAKSLQRLFSDYAKRCGFEIDQELVFPVGGMLFVAASGDVAGLPELAKFSMLRVVRPMPRLRGHRPLARSTPVQVGFAMPTAAPMSDEPKVAVLDGGLPADHGLGRFVRRYERSDPEANDVEDYLDHGQGVTSAALFGPIEAGETARRPFSYVDHYRVLDEGTDGEDPLELYRTLGHIEEVLLSRRYQFLNLSLGPNLSVEDTDVHAWTAVIDSNLSDGATLMTIAAGNNGQSDSALGLDRVQVPADSVNALAVGAADRTNAEWARAPYSARGPGRNPGVRKPDITAFGGSPKEYFHVARAGARPELSASMGTSYAAPFALRTGVGVRAVLGEEVLPLTIKALLIHGAEMGAHHDELDVGWGRIPEDINELIVCGDGMARIIYQGYLRSGKFLRAPVPLPKSQLEGKVELSATFCYASAVDVEDAAAYTRAGLGITFRPNASKLTESKRNAATRGFFSTKEFRTEQSQRADLGKWETVMHASHKMYGSTLLDAAFDIHYNARDGGGGAGNKEERIPYALVLTVKAKRHANLYDDILAAHAKLQAIEPRVTLPIRIGT